MVENVYNSTTQSQVHEIKSIISGAGPMAAAKAEQLDELVRTQCKPYRDLRDVYRKTLLDRDPLTIGEHEEDESGVLLRELGSAAVGSFVWSPGS